MSFIPFYMNCLVLLNNKLIITKLWKKITYKEEEGNRLDT